MPTRAVPLVGVPRAADGRGGERAYLGLLAAGTVPPYARALPWIAEHGADVPGFVRAAFATRISSFFAWDVVVASSTLLVAAAVDPELTGGQRALVSIGALGGTSVGLPLYLWLRERNRRASRTGGGGRDRPGLRATSARAA